MLLVHDTAKLVGGAEQFLFSRAEGRFDFLLADRLIPLKGFTPTESLRENTFVRLYSILYKMLWPIITKKRYRTTVVSGSDSLAFLVFGKRISKSTYYYCHTPPDFLCPETAKRRRPSMELLARFLGARRLIVQLLDGVSVIANSEFTRTRLKSLNVSSSVLYPVSRLKKPRDLPVPTVMPNQWCSVSRLEDYKRVDYVLEVFALLPGFELTVCSYGSLFRSYVDKYSSRPSSGAIVRFLGRTDRVRLEANI